MLDRFQPTHEKLTTHLYALEGKFLEIIKDDRSLIRSDPDNPGDSWSVSTHLFMKAYRFGHISGILNQWMFI